MGKRQPFRLTERIEPEHPLQKQIAWALAIEIAPAGTASRDGVCWFAIDHANFAGLPGVRAARGVVAGIPDFEFLFRGLAHFIELKTEVGRLNDAQRERIPALQAAGAAVAIARSLPDVLARLDAWGIPRHRRTTL